MQVDEGVCGVTDRESLIKIYLLDPFAFDAVCWHAEMAGIPCKMDDLDQVFCCSSPSHSF